MAYAQKRKFTINNAQVGGASGTITDYPVLISGTFAGSGSDPDLRTTANGGSIQNTDATGGTSGSVTVPADLAFYDDPLGTTQYDHEVVSYTATTGQFEAWVRIPTLNKASDTDFYMHYSDSGVTTSQENVGGVWEANYKGVWHLQASSGTRYDSSGNANNLTDNTVLSGTGKVGTGADFENANSEYLSITDASQTGLDITADMTVLLWAKPESLSSTIGANYAFVTKDDATTAERGYYAYFDSADDDLLIAYSDGTNFTIQRTDSPFFVAGDVGNWVFSAYATDVSATTSVIYKNGSSVASTQLLSASTSIKNNTAPFIIGGHYRAGAPEWYFDGLLDEVRVYSGILDADYITTVYNNENSPSTFYTIATVPDEYINVSETVTITESVTLTVVASNVPSPFVSETVTLTEETTISVQEATPLSLSVEETATISETVTLATDALTISVAETATITDEPSIFVEDANNTFSLTVTETITITETVSGSGFGHNSTLWTDVTNKRGNVWTSSNDYKADD